MKKLILTFLVLILLSGCGQEEKTASDDDLVHIGVLQLMEHESLDQAYEGFKAALNDAGYDETKVSYNFQNPNNDRSALATMAAVLVNEEPDLILAIGTGAAQALQQESTEIPILGTAITDYLEVGLVEDNERPGGNISGSSDYVDMAIQMDLIAEFVPDIHDIGLLYTSSEQNSLVQADAMKAECAKRGWDVNEKTISDLTMVNDTMMAFVGEIDALYIPTDNPLASSMASVDIVAKENNIPVFVGWTSGVNDGALASVGINYYNLGYSTGLNAVKLLNEEVVISELPIYFTDSESVEIYYNGETASAIKVAVPEDISSKGIDLSQN